MKQIKKWCNKLFLQFIIFVYYINKSYYKYDTDYGKSFNEYLKNSEKQKEKYIKEKGILRYKFNKFVYPLLNFNITLHEIFHSIFIILLFWRIPEIGIINDFYLYKYPNGISKIPDEKPINFKKKINRLFYIIVLIAPIFNFLIPFILSFYNPYFLIWLGLIIWYPGFFLPSTDDLLKIRYIKLLKRFKTIEDFNLFVNNKDYNFETYFLNKNIK